MDSPCIKQTVCKVLKIFQYGKYLVAYVLKGFVSLKCIFSKCGKGSDLLHQTGYWDGNGYSYIFLIFNRRLSDVSEKVIHALHDILM